MPLSPALPLPLSTGSIATIPIMKNTLIITAFAALAAAQSITDLPTCSLSCLTTAIPQLGCGLTDLKCSCQKAGELTPILTQCVQKSCSEADQKKTLEVLAAICAASGAPISTPPASSAVVPEETATPEPLPSPTAVETQPSASEKSESYPTATSVAEIPSSYPGTSLFYYIILPNLLTPPPSTLPLELRRSQPPFSLFLLGFHPSPLHRRLRHHHRVSTFPQALFCAWRSSPLPDRISRVVAVAIAHRQRRVYAVCELNDARVHGRG